MKNNLSKIIMLSFFAISGLYASSANPAVAENKGNKTENKGAATFAYDAREGWWWYQETVKDEKGEDVEIKTKMTTKEKLEHEQKDKLIKLMAINNDKLEKIQERLDYAFPNLTSIYTVNEKTGEKCLTNSSVECFEFPLQPEARHVPVLASWLENPSPTNSKEWLKWESKYFNHLGKISVGNRFAFLNGGPSVYETDTTFVYDDSLSTPQSEDNQEVRKSVILNKVKDNLGLMIFLGANTGLENTLNIYEDLKHYSHESFKDINKIFVVPSKNSIKLIENKLKELNIKEAIEFWKTANIQVKPELFTKFNIMVTPSVVAVYKKDKDKSEKDNSVWQIVHTGSIGIATVRGAVIKFLIYNDIIKSSELSAALNNAEAEKNMIAKDPIIDNSKILKDLNKLEEVN